MPYPTYQVTFVGEIEDPDDPTKIKPSIVVAGSHALVLRSANTRVSVELTQNAPNDTVPTLIVTFQ